MAFNFMQNRLQKTINKVRSKGQLSEENITDVLRDIRLILLESDVNLKVVDEFIDRVKTKALGQIVAHDRTSSQAILKIIYEELTKILGSDTKT